MNLYKFKNVTSQNIIKNISCPVHIHQNKIKFNYRDGPVKAKFAYLSLAAAVAFKTLSL